MDDIAMLGTGGTARPRKSLNLAGTDGFFPPAVLAGQAQEEPLKTPDYTVPDMATPALRPGDLAACGTDSISEPAAFTADPTLPAENAPMPNALHVVTDTGGLMPEPGIERDVPDNMDIAVSLSPGLGFPGLSVNHEPKTRDVGIPDLQNPQTRPMRSMQGRPGELDPLALSALHKSQEYQAVRGKEYPDVFMDARGNNSRRSREHTLLMQGLDAQQPGRQSRSSTPGGY